jgi:predicted NBD/HSP70 family sugar kinase
VLAGTHGVSGELGHVPVPGVDRHCHCGAIGCLDTVASTDSILRDVSAVAGEVFTDLEAAVAHAHGDPRAQQVFERAGHAVGVGIASMVNLFGPQCVVLTGEGLAALELIRDPIRSGFVEQPYGQAIHCEIIIRPLGFETWAHGAATIALQAYVRGESPSGDLTRPAADRRGRSRLVGPYGARVAAQTTEAVPSLTGREGL